MLSLNNKTNLLGIIIPTYNYAKYLEDAILSALATIELIGGKVIVVDDASTDNSLKIIQKFKQIELIQLKKQMGAPYARNMGANFCDTKYLLFLDSDDVLYPQSIQRMVLNIEKNQNFDVIYSDFLLCDEKLNPLKKWSDNRDNRPKDQIVKLCWDSIIGMPALVIRKTIFNKVGGFIDLPRAQDWDLAIRLVALKNFKYINCLAHKRRGHRKSYWEKNNDERCNNFKKVLAILKKDHKFRRKYTNIHRKRFACIYRSLAEVCYVDKKYNLSLSYINKAENMISKFADANVIRAKIYFEQKKFLKVINCLKSETRPVFLKEYEELNVFFLAFSYYAISNISECRNILIKNKKITMNPKYDYLRGKLYQTEKKYHMALKYFDKCIAKYNKENYKYCVSSYYNKANILIIKRKYNNAIFEISNCLRLDPKHNKAKQMLKQLRKRCKERTKSNAYFN